MAPLIYDLGISVEQIHKFLQEDSIITIVGYMGSGKSTLAELLREGLENIGYNVYMQGARNWLPNRERQNTRKNRTQAYVDPELVNMMKLLEENPGENCWIIDDAEILLAYSTDTLLQSLGARLKSKKFSIILVRNRFIIEDSGWLSKRLDLIFPNPKKIAMRPLETEYAIEITTSLFSGYSKQSQGEWLASMSGGIPGLIGMLYPYTPEWPSEDLPNPVEQFVIDKQKELELDKPIRNLLLTALRLNVLPPYTLLQPKVKSELGALLLSGMVSFKYTTSNSFQGMFWELVSKIGQGENLEPDLDNFLDIGLNLEIIFREGGVADIFCNEFDIELEDEGLLGKLFAVTLYCQTYFTDLVQGLDYFISEIVGKIGLIRLFNSQGISVDMSSSSIELTQLLIQRAST